jgi:hypothetical protein
MNEQHIKQLVGQAKFMTEEALNCKLSFNSDLKTFSEFFADLIIRECADVVADINQDYDGGSTTVNAAEEIKQHFGIE